MRQLNSLLRRVYALALAVIGLAATQADAQNLSGRWRFGGTTITIQHTSNQVRGIWPTGRHFLSATQNGLNFRGRTIVQGPRGHAAVRCPRYRQHWAPMRMRVNRANNRIEGQYYRYRFNYTLRGAIRCWTVGGIWSRFSFARVGPAPQLPAACRVPARPSCGFYVQCFNRVCPCRGSGNEYALGYGNKYCSRFLHGYGWSAVGRRWRDATLRCLQERARQYLPRGGRCNCAQVQARAYASHTPCYTLPGRSICDLPLRDVRLIWRMVSLRDLFDRRGLSAMRDIASICINRVPTALQAAWRAVRNKIARRSRR